MSEVAGRPVGSQYRIGGLIGRGGMGEVWRGVDASGVPVAVKVLLPRFAEDPGVVQRFVGERRLLTGVVDPHVVRVRDMVAEGSTLAIVMDLVEGGDLRGLLRERGTLPAAEACRVGSQVALGLAAIHARRIVHRDVKPENVLLDRTVDPPVALLTDFGVSKLVGDDPGASGVTALAGTPLYLAPELIAGGRPGPWSDLYSLGVVLYELVCGVTPFTGLVPAAVLHAQVSLLPGRPAGFDDRLWNLVWQLLGKDPVHRPADAGLVAAQLAQLAGLLEGQRQLVKLSAPPPPVVADPQQLTRVAGAGGFAATQLVAPQQPTPPWVSTPVSGSQDPRSFRGVTPTPTPMGYAPTPAHPMPVSNYVIPAEPGGPKRGTAVLAGVVAGLAVAIIAMVAFGAVALRDDASAGQPADAGGVTAAPSTAERMPETEPSVVTVTAPRPAETTVPPTRAAAWPPAGASLCSSSLAVNDATSCSFAANVASAYYAKGAGVVQAYSPVTQQWYDMTCQAVTANVVRCTGGTNAVVYVRQ